MSLGSMLDHIVIVIVDDHDDTRLFLSEFLMRRGAIVFACSNAFDALETVRVRQPDVVLSDISLPNRNGFELLHDIRSLGPERGGSVPVIAMTALKPIVDQGRAEEAGFQTHLNKPFRPEQLLDAVHSVLD
jgi:CheY-like chemotaxis protein